MQPGARMEVDAASESITMDGEELTAAGGGRQLYTKVVVATQMSQCTIIFARDIQYITIFQVPSQNMHLHARDGWQDFATRSKEANLPNFIVHPRRSLRQQQCCLTTAKSRKNFLPPH